MIPHFLSNHYSAWAKNLVTSQDRNASTFLEKTIIQSWPKIWLHLYTEMIPRFLRRKQCFHIKMRFILSMLLIRNKQLFCYRCLSLSLHNSVVRATTGEFAKYQLLSRRFILTILPTLRILCIENLFITENTE